MSDTAPAIEEVRTPRGLVLRGYAKHSNWSATIGPMSVSLFRSDPSEHNRRGYVTASVSQRGILGDSMHAYFGKDCRDEALAWIDNRVAEFLHDAATECAALLDAAKGEAR